MKVQLTMSLQGHFIDTPLKNILFSSQATSGRTDISVGCRTPRPTNVGLANKVPLILLFITATTVPKSKTQNHQNRQNTKIIKNTKLSKTQNYQKQGACFASIISSQHHNIIRANMHQQQFYAFQQVFPKGAVRAVALLPNLTPTTLAVATDSSLELHTLTPTGLSLQKKTQLHCRVVALKAIPDHHRQTDFLFVLDSQGNAAFWDPSLGTLQTPVRATPAPSHQQIFESGPTAPLFCQSIFRLDVLDTRGSICFMHRHSIKIIDYSVKSQGLKIEGIRNLDCPYLKCRQIGWLIGSKEQLGVIEQKQEKTVFKVHQLKKNNSFQYPTFEYGKMNLLEFKAIKSGQILLLTDQQILVLSLHSRTVIARHPIHCENARLLVLQPELYGCLGSEMILINDINIKHYGSLDLNGSNLFEGKELEDVASVGRLPDGSRLVSVLTSNNDCLFLSLHQKSWSLYDSVESIGPIFSLQQIPALNCYLAVTSTAQDRYAAWVLQQQLVLPLEQQPLPATVEHLVLLFNGQYLLLVGQTANSILEYSLQNKDYQNCSVVIPPSAGQFLAANDSFYCTSSDIYIWNIPQNKHELICSGSYQLVSLSDTTLTFMDTSLVVWQYKSGHFSPLKARQGSPYQYLWYLSDDTLFAAVSDRLGQLSRWQGQQKLSPIILPSKQIVSSVLILNNSMLILAVGFNSGNFSIFNASFDTLLFFSSLDSHPVTFFPSHSSLGVLAGTRIYLVDHDMKPQLLRLSSKQSDIQTAVYSSKIKSIIYVDNSKTALCSASVEGVDLKGKGEIQCRKTLISQSKREIPVLYGNKDNIFVAINKKLQIFDWKRRVCIQEIANFLTEVIGIQLMDEGFLLYGIDELRRNTLILINKPSECAEFEIRATLHLLLKDRRYIKTIKIMPAPAQSNAVCAFLCRGQKQTALFEVSESWEVNEVGEVKTDFQGYSLEIGEEGSHMSFTDGFRFLAVYTCSNTAKMLPICRYVADAEINEHLLLSRAVILADRKGVLTLLEYNTEDPQQPLRMLMTKVASLKVGEEVTSLALCSPGQALYGTVEGKVGKVRVIPQNVYEVLSRAERRGLELLEKEAFEYQEWRGGAEEDKGVDLWLVDEFIRRCRQSDCEDDLQLVRLMKESINSWK